MLGAAGCLITGMIHEEAGLMIVAGFSRFVIRERTASTALARNSLKLGWPKTGLNLHSRKFGTEKKGFPSRRRLPPEK